MDWLGTRRIPVLFAPATLLPLAAVCWLGVRTLAPDRELERQRHGERLKVAADRVALDMERDLRQITSRIVSADGRRIAVTQETSKNEIRVLRNIPPATGAAR